MMNKAFGSCCFLYQYVSDTLCHSKGIRGSRVSWDTMMEEGNLSSGVRNLDAGLASAGTQIIMSLTT